jgi:hypothetical protein
MVENITRLNMAGRIQSPRGAMKVGLVVLVATVFFGHSFCIALQRTTKGLHPSQNK